MDPAGDHQYEANDEWLDLKLSNEPNLNLELQLNLARNKKSKIKMKTKMKKTRDYSCKHCDKKFPNSQALGGHQNAHKRERAILKMEKEWNHLKEAAAAFGFGYINNINTTRPSIISNNIQHDLYQPYPYHHHHHHPTMITTMHMALAASASAPPISPRINIPPTYGNGQVVSLHPLH